MKNLLNIFKKTKIIMILILSFLLFLYITISAFSYAQTVSYEISDSVFRLHVIANSDNIEDQNLKYKVRDNLLQYMNDICKNCSSKQEAIELVQTHKKQFEQIALNTIANEGFSYNITVNIGNFKFPTKNYGDISLPSGFYDALRIEIGEAKGQNWWCVMFPPLCFVDITSGIVPDESKELIEKNLSEEEFSLVSNNSDEKIHFKFKLLEFFNDTGLITAKK